ncbi:MAG: nuclear transport factor 2 family protein [Actinomycetota bacterium]
MAHPNEDRARKAFDAFIGGDLDTVGETLTDDVLWHVPGRSPLAGDYRGKDEVFGLFAQLVEKTGGTFRLEVHDILANDEHVVALTRTTGEREGKKLDIRSAQVLHVNADGQVTESWFHPDDAYAADEFWSS